jgi:glycosyltransferase involved in cell wall biosynthesis
MKVLISLSRLEHGGAELRTLALITALSKETKHEFYIFLTSGQIGSLDADFINVGAKLIYAKSKKASIYGLYKALKDINPNVLHVNANLAGGLFCLAGKLAKTKKIFAHIRTASDYGDGIGYKLKIILYKFILNKYSHKVIGVCDGARIFSGTPKNKWKTIYNGFNPSTRLTKLVNYNNVSLLVLGRMHIAKNLPFSIYILQNLIENHPDIKWSMNFWGKEDIHIKENLLDIANELGVIKNVYFNGVTNNPIEIIHQHDMLLLTSIREGLPGVVLESISIGVPVVCSALEGCLEIEKKTTGVKTLRLEEPLTKWSEEIINYLSIERKSIKGSFLTSPFIFEQHKKEMLELWEKEIEDKI